MKKISEIFKCLVSLLALILFSVHSEAREVKIGYTNHVSQLVAAKILREIYKRANIELSLQSFPGARLNSLIQSKALDGETARIAEYYKNKNYLKKIETPIYYFDAWLYIHQDESKIVRSIEDLKNDKIGILRGILYGEMITKGFQHVIRADGSKQLFDLLSLRGIDAVIDTDFTRLAYTSKFNEQKIRPAFLIKRYYLYHGLRTNLENEYNQINKLMNELSRSGELEKITKLAEQEVLLLPAESIFILK